MAVLSIVVAIIIAILLLLATTDATSNSASSAKQCYGPDYSEIYPFYGIPTDICIHAYYNSSTTKSLLITLSYGNTVYGSETFTDQDPAYDEKQICDPTFPAPIESVHSCSICLGFDDIFLSDGWARICPKYILKCKTPIGHSWKRSYPTPCFNVGDDDKDDIAMIVGGNTDFSFKLLATNGMTTDIVTDLFVSPFSITNALVMTMMAANGETLKQLMSLFELDTDDYAVFDSYDTLIQALQHKTEDLMSSIDNKLWINNMWKQVISPQFLKDFDRFGEIEGCNFRNDSYIETMKIDTETEQTTHDLIKHPLANKNLSSSTVMLFTNTMYFKGNWLYPFTQNISQTFTDTDNEKVTIEMMITDDITVNKYNDSEVEVIELPFADDFSDISFIMIRPTQEKYLEDGPTSTIEFEKSLNRVLLSKWLNSLSEADDYTQRIKLPFLEMYNMEDVTDSLQVLGVTDLFDPQKADLTNLTVPHYQVYETNLNRQDYMKITNKGIEMASFVTDGNNGKEETNQGKVEHADLPFLFLIMDRSVNLILYAGRVTNPKGWIIYTPDGHQEKHSHFGTVVLTMFLVIIISYFVIKFGYNLTVMKLRGFEAIPHIEQCRACKSFCGEKVGEIKNKMSNNPRPIMSPPRSYAELMGDDNMKL